jgi:hypothetical protein
MKGKLNSILDSNVPKLAKKMELNLDGIKSIKLPKKTTKKSKVNV